MKIINIAIDGPAGAGKSTISKEISKEMHYLYIDTGAMFRAVAYYVLSHGGDTESSKSVNSMLDDIDIDLRQKDGAITVYLNGEDVSSLIRTPEVSRGASDVGTIPEVREKLLQMQRKIASEQSVVMDGRDIGSHVLPNAQVKIFLTADVAIRARRRLAELVQKGENVTFDEVLKDMKFRDKNDSERAIAPLCKADDAIEIDTTHLTLPQSIEAVKKAVKDKIKKIK
ncbi:MAG: (d)CMP kinase [Clostridia bacterium]|nr:(d)CMP kinase [Clostridia bacterium]